MNFIDFILIALISIGVFLAGYACAMKRLCRIMIDLWGDLSKKSNVSDDFWKGVNYVDSKISIFADEWWKIMSKDD